MSICIERISEQDRDWVRAYLRERWGSPQVITRGVVHQADRLPGFVAYLNGAPAGLTTYHIEGDGCEIVSLNSEFEGLGIGSALLEVVRQQAERRQCKRLWLVTTNDNTEAIRFYQKRGYALVAVHRNAIERSRQIKPSIPDIGRHGIPIRDEIECELLLTGD
jgi:DNA-3-methyladenine glycosylase I